MIQLPVPAFKHLRDETPDSKRFVIIQYIENDKVVTVMTKYHNGTWTSQVEKVKFRTEDISDTAIWFESPLQNFHT